MVYLRYEFKPVAGDAHPITGHGENISSPTRKVKVTFQVTVQQ